METQPAPPVISVEMGYGHLRAALPLVDALGGELLYADAEPLADDTERKTWARVRRVHELLSRPSQWSALLGDPTRFMDQLSSIPPLYSERDLSQPTFGNKLLDFFIARGLGRGLSQFLRETGAPLVTTFYAPAIIADRARSERIYCVVTDADINRVWVPTDSHRSKIHYFAPSQRVTRRLQAYGVPRHHITLTGFPLPTELLGGPSLDVLHRDVAERLVRLDPQGTFRELHKSDLERVFGTSLGLARQLPVHLVFAVGGAGAQAEMASDFLPSLRNAIVTGKIKVTLVAGTRPDVARTFERAITEAELHKYEDGVRVLLSKDFHTYYREFNQLLRTTDILWTKPSELSFYAALGLALVLAKPVGSHERFNRRWLREQGVALKQDNPRHVGHWLDEWLNDGTLAGAAWMGFLRMPKDGTYQIAAQVRGESKIDRRRSYDSYDNAVTTSDSAFSGT